MAVYIEDFTSGRIAYKVEGNYIYDFTSGRVAYKINRRYVPSKSDVESPTYSTSGNYAGAAPGGNSPMTLEEFINFIMAILLIFAIFLLILGDPVLMPLAIGLLVLYGIYLLYYINS